ncbi:MAG: FAD-dependent oxidoreductase [Kiritimatiellae bacterium]|nr:FAD-dependent oxidoreductase [Kiritimatiellia bacterium]
MCYAEPLVEIGLPDGRRVLYGDLTAERVAELTESFILNGDPRPDLALATFGDVACAPIPSFSELPMIAPQVRIVLRNAGLIDPQSVDHYIARGGYSGLAKALKMTPAAVIEEVRRSGLRGRGGAGFPTGTKWGFARKAAGELKYVVCNADEGDPGAFMDRSVLESDPHAVLEGLVIAAYAVGASHGYVYVRAEYPLAIERLRTAIRQMEELGFLGERIMGTEFSFAVRIKEGAGAFVCGEETALMASIEGRRGAPRPRPPFPANSGLHGKPTNINNVETLANVSAILASGADWFTQYGTQQSRGTKTFALAGKINRTGLIEVPMGMKLRDVIFQIGGGIPDGKPFKAVQTGGPSGGCIPAELLDLPVDYEELTKAGSIMGSGGMIVMDEESCMVDVTKYFLEFTHSESCGKCIPCRMGSQHLLRILGEITAGAGRPEHIAVLEKLAKTVKSGSLCGLGQTLPNPVLNTLRYFRNEFEEHVIRKRCDALVCKGIISSPCQYTCPIHQDVPAYMGYLAQGEFDRAIAVIRRENPFPGICGRVCPHPCEERCEAGKHGEPIAIRALKRFAADYELKRGARPARAAVRYEEKVAVVGAGPAGLTAAYYLTLKGYACTVFEALPVAGGMLAVGIPDYRLPPAILAAEIAYIRETGVAIRLNAALGRDFTLKSLSEEGYRAVFIATGAHKPVELRIPGAEHPAVIPGVEFLRRVNAGENAAVGARVAVIGGGNVAIDSARSAVRLGCKEVFIVYRRAREQMPALPEELRQLEEEDIRIEFLAGPVKAVIENGTFKGVECIRMELGEPDASGRRRPVPVDGSEFFIACDNLISAISQSPDAELLKQAGLPVTDWGTIQADPETLQTERAGVFAGGDAVAGPANVVTAIAHGKRAAISIDQHLRGARVAKEYRPVRPAVQVDPVELTDEELEQLARPVMPAAAPAERCADFREVEGGLSEATAVLEAKRCLRCDLEAAMESA